jgi:hypothetical protein
MFRSSLAREISMWIVLKVAALGLLFVLFFGPDTRPDVDSDGVGRMLFGAGEQRGVPRP